MNSLLLAVTLVGSNITITSYQSIRNQTDSSPFFTSIGERTRHGGVAVSRDMLCGACRRLHRRCAHPEDSRKLHYGDWLYVREIGFVRVNDVMGAYTTERVKGRKVRIPIAHHIDVWVGGLVEERAFHKKWKGKPVELYRIEVKEKS